MSSLSPQLLLFCLIYPLLSPDPKKDVLAFYNPKAETELIVDASPYGLGAMLSQQQSDGTYK